MLLQAEWMAGDADVAHWMHTLSSKGYKIIFTGHSLGGGLVSAARNLHTFHSRAFPPVHDERTLTELLRFILSACFGLAGGL